MTDLEPDPGFQQCAKCGYLMVRTTSQHTPNIVVYVCTRCWQTHLQGAATMEFWTAARRNANREAGD